MQRKIATVTMAVMLLAVAVAPTVYASAEQNNCYPETVMQKILQDKEPYEKNEAVKEPVVSENQQPAAASENNAAPLTADGNLSGLSALEREMVEYVNGERVKAGLNPLQVDIQLSNVARVKSQDMVDNGYFAHNSPTYGSPFEMMRDFGIRY